MIDALSTGRGTESPAMVHDVSYLIVACAMLAVALLVVGSLVSRQHLR